MQTLVFKKQHFPGDVPAFSNRDVYEFINGKKPPGKVQKQWLKTKRFFSLNETWTGRKSGIVSGLLLCFLIVVSVLFLRGNSFPIQLGAACFFFLFILSKGSRKTQLFYVSGVLAILLAVLVPVLVFNLYSSLLMAALFLPAHLAICGIAALFRSDEHIELKFIFFKALSYLVFTIFTGWLSQYAYTNL